MMLRLLVSYDGTDLSGFAAQPGRRTVQGELEHALSELARRPVEITGAGRTDAGVHALGQVVSLQPLEDITSDRLLRALAGRLPRDISVLDAQPASDGFDARFSALWRSYVYLVHNAEAPDPVSGRFATWVPRPLDVYTLREALQVVVGTHDFSSFARIREGQSPERTVHDVTVSQEGPLIRIGLTANAFLHNMVRALVGSALEVAAGRRSVDWMLGALEAKDRSAAGPVAGPQGLTLVDVAYTDAAWPRRPAVPWPWAPFDQARLLIPTLRGSVT